jgi:hypothetical protein
MDTHTWRNTYHRAIRSTTLLRTMKTIRNMSVFSPLDCQLDIKNIAPLDGASAWAYVRPRYYSPSTMILLNLKNELKTHQLELH